MLDIDDRRALEDRHALLGRCPRLAPHQIEWVQMQVGIVAQRAVIQRRIQQVAQRVFFDPVHDIAHAARLGGIAIGLERGHVARLPGRLQMAVLEIAGDAVACHALFDNALAAPAQIPYERLDVAAGHTVQVFLQPGLAGQAAGDLAAVAPGRAPADTMRLEQSHVVAALGQLQRGCHAGEAAPDHGHIDPAIFCQRHIRSRLDNRGRVIRAGIGGRALSHGRSRPAR